MTQTTQIVLPAALAKRQTPAGSHHLGLKALFYGPPKSGKSFALASFPHPIFALACGENGIELYLKPELGDVSVYVDDADSYLAALEFALAHPKVASIVVDNINLAFEDWMSSWEDKLNIEEIKGQHWKRIKGPWKTIHKKIMHSPKNFACSAWPKGAKYIEEEIPAKMPGAEPKTALRMLEQDSAHVEKMLPFVVDLILKTEIELDKKFAPTKTHRVTYVGGRRASSIPANELYAGKFWQFDSSKVGEVSPFDRVLKPILEKWQEGAVDYVGIDPGERQFELGEAANMADDQLVGSILAAFAGSKTLAELKTIWDNGASGIDALPPDKRKLIVDAKNSHPAYPKKG